jgi:predicted DNA binding CopG/RHH family protein
MAKRRRFKSEDAEREFWSKQDSTEIVDWTRAERVTLAALRPSLETISLRLPTLMLEEIKRLAHKQDVPYQSLIKLFLAERVKREIEESPAAVSDRR